MGATGTGKSKLAIDIATHFQPAEIINSDKIQAYQGLDITTNKVTDEECRGVHHHLLGTVDPNSNFTSNDFCEHATEIVDSIVGRNGLPIIAGGSNSYIEALVNHYPEFRTRLYGMWKRNMHRLDATDVVLKERNWEDCVLDKSLRIVHKFLYEDCYNPSVGGGCGVGSSIASSSVSHQFI
ncbi:hypothetical protein TSUD_196380 [Trifolium subterraneum]|nr:hypothetical protein TSUD_196380 [Trifolium subterraneum]